MTTAIDSSTISSETAKRPNITKSNHFLSVPRHRHIRSNRLEDDITPINSPITTKRIQSLKHVEKELGKEENIAICRNDIGEDEKKELEKKLCARANYDQYANLRAAASGEKTGTYWDIVHQFATLNELHYANKLATLLNANYKDQIVVDLFHSVILHRLVRDPEIEDYFNKVPDDWYKEPYYYTYVQYFGAKDMESYGDFDSLSDMLPYLDSIGLKNIYILPHYRSPGGDSGYDISSYTPNDDPEFGLGGSSKFTNFMKEVRKKGFRVITDGVFNHTSIEHEWFQKAKEGDEKYLKYYLLVDDWKWIKEEDRSGDIWVTYKDSKDNEMERILIFPDVSKSHLYEFNAKGTTRKAYYSFYPFQLDLDLQNPDVVHEIWTIIGNEINQGILGKRTDAIAHWLKPLGRRGADGNPETYAIQGLLKLYLKMLCDKTIIIPEAVKQTIIARSYLGEDIHFNGKKTTTQGDAMFNFEQQGSMREALFFQTSSAFWDYWGNSHVKIPVPSSSCWINLLGHHDEMYLGFIRERNRDYFRDYLRNHGCLIYKNGMSAGGRMANCLNKDPLRIALSFFVMYMSSGIPCIYYGDEIGWPHSVGHARRQQGRQHKILNKLGLKVSYSQALDPRDLHRGSIPKDIFYEHVRNEYFPLEVIKRLNKLYKNPAVSSPDLHPVTCFDDGILCLEKYVNSEEGKKYPPVLCVANLTHESKLAVIPIIEFNPVLHNFDESGKNMVFQQLIGTNMSNNGRNVSVRFENGNIYVGLYDYSFILFGKRK